MSIHPAAELRAFLHDAVVALERGEAPLCWSAWGRGATVAVGLALAPVGCQRPEVCDDSRDDDGDGAIDCADSDCADNSRCGVKYGLPGELLEALASERPAPSVAPSAPLAAAPSASASAAPSAPSSSASTAPSSFGISGSGLVGSGRTGGSGVGEGLKYGIPPRR